MSKAKRKGRPPVQPRAQDGSPLRIGTVNLKDVLGDIQTYGSKLHGSPSPDRDQAYQ